jgi:hypothetical protein
MMDDLRRKIIEKLRNNPPNEDGGGLFKFSIWLSKNLSQEDFEALDKIERLYGEECANEWFCDVLVESGLYRSPEPGLVERI